MRYYLALLTLLFVFTGCGTENNPFQDPVLIDRMNKSSTYPQSSDSRSSSNEGTNSPEFDHHLLTTWMGTYSIGSEKIAVKVVD